MTAPVPRWPAVVFDLDGTLVDTVGLIVASYQHAFRTVLGAEEDEARIRAWIGQPLIRAFREVSPERADELFATYLEWNSANTERLIRRYAGIDTMLAALDEAGVAVAAATSKLRGPAEMAVRLTGLAEHLDVLVTLEDTVYVGDAVVDVKAARNAGMSAIGVTWGAGTREAVATARPDVLADTVDDLVAALLPGRALLPG